MSDDRTIENKTDEFHYAILMETNGKEYESWYYFIRWEGNEEALRHLQKQIESMDFYILDDLSTFDLDLEHLVSEKTAKEMTKVELNALMFHRKFDGKLDKIDLKLNRRDSNDKKLVKIFKKLGIGRIDDFIDGEDIDPEDLASGSEDDSESDETDYNYEISESDEESDQEETRKDKKKRKESFSDISDEEPKNDTKKKLEKMKNKMKNK